MMENKAFVSSVAARTGCSVDDVNKLTEGFSELLRRECAALNRVAIPGFGSFEGVKHDEEVRTDLSTGVRMMFPPCIEVEFKASGKLNKRLNS